MAINKYEVPNYIHIFIVYVLIISLQTQQDIADENLSINTEVMSE